MGYAIIHLPRGDLILGDDVGQNAAKRDLCLPHYDENGRYVSLGEISRREKNAGTW